MNDRALISVLKRYAVGLALLLAAACNPNPPRIVIITATPEPLMAFLPGTLETPLPLTAEATVASGQSASSPASNLRQEQHIVRPGESLSLIAQQYGTTVQTLVALNNITDPNRIEVGQVILLPSETTVTAPNITLLPDARFVRGPESIVFDTFAYIAQQRSFIRTVTDTVRTNTATGASFEETLSSAEVIERVALEHSVDPRLLITVLEYRAGWVSQVSMPPEQEIFPIITAAESGGLNRAGLYRQLAYAANELNRGYYGFKTRGLRAIEFRDGTRMQLPTTINPATVGVMFFLSRQAASYSTWLAEVGSQRFTAVYRALFGDPFVTPLPPPVPSGLQQPILQLPFAQDEVWLYTGGPHGGWGSGSAWAALDFAPPDERQPGSALCYISTTPVRAAASGIIARSADGAVVLDLDRDGDERTGWTIFYLHVAEAVPPRTLVQAGDIIGYASCAGGFSTATHLHIGRRYNGEWLAADCSQCIAEMRYDNFVMSNWEAEGIPGQEYQGFLRRGNLRQTAQQGRLTLENRISW
jgi:LasA protease